MRSKGLGILLGLALVAVPAMIQIPAAAGVGDVLVSVGSASTRFSQNKQNEPAVTIDPAHTNVVAAGSNDNIDMELCAAGDPTTCPFTADVGGSGIYFSFDGGITWTQPTYTGLTARHCVGPAACVPAVGPIGTLPWYYENGLVSDGDPALVFGPRPDSNGDFSWTNGSRLYYANLTSSFSGAFKGFEAIAVSRTDDVAGAAAGNQNTWMAPVLASKQSSADFADKEQIWADNAESSAHFGNVYVCYAEFRGSGAAPVIVARSTDGGDTWSQKQVSPASNVAPSRWGRSGCTIRTDSDGAAYIFWELFQSPFFFSPPEGSLQFVKSTDGGASWSRPQTVTRVTDSCWFVDPVTFRCTMDGVAGARDDLASAPSVDIANGAPTGADATDRIVMTWIDASDGQNDEHVMFSTSTNGGATWSPPNEIESDPGDRGYYVAPAISPDGTDVYVVYNAFTAPFQTNNTSPRPLLAVVLHADVTGGSVGSWTQLHRSVTGDARAASQNNLVAEFLGDYVYAFATRGGAVAVWNDARDGANCPAIDAWRDSLRTASPLPTPAPGTDCPANFGDTSIYGGSFADPS